MAMYREFKVTDPGGIIEFEVYPSEANRIKIVKWNIDLTLEADKQMNNMIDAVSLFMNKNTITKLEVEEKQT